MATSGTTTWNPDQVDLIEHAASMAGAELRTGYEMRAARFSLNLLLQGWANRGLNLWTVTNATIPLVAGTATYNLPTDCVDVVEAAIRTGSGTTQSDITIRRLGFAQYTAIPTKTTQGRPVQFFVQRLIAPTITLWPVPDGTQTWTLYYYYLRRLQDAGTSGDNTFDAPTRFIPALILGLAFHIAMLKPELSDRAQSLKQLYDEEFEMAAGEDRERAPVRWVPRMGNL